MSSRNRRWALPALTTLGLLVSGCAGTPTPPTEDAAAAPVVARHVTIAPHAVVTPAAEQSTAPATPAAATNAPAARTRSASPAPQVRPSAVPAPRPAPSPRAGKRSWDRPRPSVSAPARTLLARAHVAAGAPVRVVSVRNVDGRPQVSVTTASDRPEATDAITRAQQAPGAVAVGVDTRVHAADTGTVTALATANDTYRSSEWALTRLGAEDLWAEQPGRGTIVAVVDTGVDASHPDLSGHVLSGTDYVTPGGNGSDDENGHGTHVAGIIAATANNHLGIAGLAQGVEILPVRVLDSTGSGWDSNIAQAIDYAADKGASVINLSLGGGPSSVTATAVSYALSKGVVVVAAAGNDGPTTNTTSYPAAYPGVLAVAASNSSDAIADFSTRGSYVDVAAPGDYIVSTVPGAGYEAMSGTSMATPFAAAAAALVHAASPTLSPDQVDSVLEQTADDLGAPGRDDASGFGLIDPRAALQALPSTVTPTPGPTAPTTTQPAPAPTAPSTEPVPVTAPDPQPTVTATSTRILSRSRVVRYGSRVRGAVAVSDEAGAPLAGVPVEVCLTVAGAPGRCATAVTSSSGRAGYVLRVRAGTTVTASFGGDATHAASTSEPVVYTVAPRLTVRRHHRSLTVRLGAEHRRLVTLQRLSHGRWVNTAHARVAPGGRHVFRHLRGGQYRVRVPATRALPGARLALRLR